MLKQLLEENWIWFLIVLIFKYSILSCSECTWCVVDNPNEEEFKSFLESIYKAECFLQVSACFVEAKGFTKSLLLKNFWHLPVSCSISETVTQVIKNTFTYGKSVFWKWPCFLQEK